MSLKNKFFLAAILCSSLLTRCSNENRTSEELYNIDSLIQTQILHLMRHNAIINKKAVLNNIEKITTIVPKDSLAWNEELAIFLELDVVNKPINKATYKVETYKDNESNLSVKAFTTTEDLPVKFIKVFYQKSLNNVRKIEAQYNEENSLYTSVRFLTMEFEADYNTTTLTSYSVDGGQKMFLDDSVQYWISASIVLKK